MFREMKADVTGFFYNPNIHPLLEFRRRLNALKVLAEIEKFPVVYDEDYGLMEYLEKVDYSGPGRCSGCYALRLSKTAEYARDNGFDAFTSTLMVSEQQKSEIIKKLGGKIAGENGIDFFCEDFSGLQAKGLEIAKKRSLYRKIVYITK